MFVFFQNGNYLLTRNAFKPKKSLVPSPKPLQPLKTSHISIRKNKNFLLPTPTGFCFEIDVRLFLDGVRNMGGRFLLDIRVAIVPAEHETGRRLRPWDACVLRPSRSECSPLTGGHARPYLAELARQMRGD